MLAKPNYENLITNFASHKVREKKKIQHKNIYN